MKKYVIGIDAGGTKVAYGLYECGGGLVDRYQHPTQILADGPTFCRHTDRVDKAYTRQKRA